MSIWILRWCFLPQNNWHFVIPLYKLRFSRGPTRHCPPRWFHICLLRICLPICIGILLGGNGRMKVVMHLGHGRKERKTTRPFCFVFFLRGKNMEEYVFFFVGGSGQEYAKIFDQCFREGERIFKPLPSRLGWSGTVGTWFFCVQKAD